MALTPDQAATVSAEMFAQRAQELAGDGAHYRLRKACQERAVDLYEALMYLTGLQDKESDIRTLLKDIHDAAQ